MSVGGRTRRKAPGRLDRRMLGIAFGLLIFSGLCAWGLLRRPHFRVPEPITRMQSPDPGLPFGGNVLPEADLPPATAVLCPDPDYTGRPLCPGASPPPRSRWKIAVNTLSRMAPFQVIASVSEVGDIPGAGPSWTVADVRWNFGCPADDRLLPDHRPGAAPDATLSANSGQFGPMAGFAYRTPGTYTIAATVRVWDGARDVSFTITDLVTVESCLVRSTSATGSYKLRVKLDAPAARCARLNNSKVATTLWAAPGHAVVPVAASGFAVSMWVRTDLSVVTEAIAGLWSEQAAAKKSWKLTKVSGVPRLYVGATASVTSSFGTINDGKWHHVAAWADAEAGVISLQVDGGTVDSAALGAAVVPNPTDVPFLIGCVLSSSGLPYQGCTNADLEEVAVWDRPLVAVEREWLWNGGAGRHHADVAASAPPSGFASGLKAWWSFDEVGAGSRSDATGNGQTLYDHTTALLGNANAGGVGVAAGRIGPPGGEVTGWIAATARSSMLGDDTHPTGAIDPGDGSLANPYQSIEGALQALPSIGPVEGNARGLGFQESPCHGGEIEFGGALAGRPVLLVPHATSDDFVGIVFAQSRRDGASAPAVTASPWDADRYPAIYFDSTMATGNNDGSAPEHAIRDAATSKSKLESISGGGRRVRFRAGSTLDFGASCPNLPSLEAPTLLDSYGDGPKPILTGSGGNGVLFNSVVTGVGKSNKAVRGLVLDGLSLVTPNIVAFRVLAYVPSSTDSGAVPPGINGSLGFLDCDFYGSQALDGPVVDIALIRQHDDVGFWRGSITCGPPATETDGFRNQKLIANTLGQFLVTGTTIGGGGGGGQTLVGQGHHCYITAYSRWAFQSVTFVEPAARSDGGAGDSKGYTHYHASLCIKGAIDDGVRIPFVAIANCDVTGCQYGVLFSRQNDRDSRYSIVDRIAILGNRFHKEYPLGPDGVATGGSGVGRIAVRKNDFWGWDNTAISVSSMTDSDGSGSGDRVDAQISGNRIRIPSTSTGAAILMTNLRSVECVDNLASRAGSATKSALLFAEWSKLSALGTAVTFARNGYESPDDSAHLDFRDVMITAPTKYPLATWQAMGFDANSAQGSLGWPDPDHGNFGETAIVTPPSETPPSEGPVIPKKTSRRTPRITPQQLKLPGGGPLGGRPFGGRPHR